MKKRVLLIDESLTVQKVVALTLDRNRYQLAYARSRTEAMKQIADSAPDLILVSDQVGDITIPSFPKELEAWLGRGAKIPPVLLITGQDVKEMRHYAGVLKKPFSPQVLQGLISRHSSMPEPAAEAAPEAGDEYEDQRLQKIFNDAFADEDRLVKETFKAGHELDERPPAPSRSGEMAEVGWEERPTARMAPPKSPPPARTPTPGDLWDVAPPAQAGKGRRAPEVLSSEDSMAYKAVLENHVETKLESQDLEEVVDKVLSKIVPPIVERLVQERLDKLLKEQEQFLELKS